MTLPRPLARMALGVLLLTCAACGDDASGDGASGASQEIVDACDPVSRGLADSLADCGDNYELFQSGCEKNGIEAESAGCLEAFLAEQSCMAEQIEGTTCVCGEGGKSFSCNLPCLDESKAVRDCVGG